MSVPILDWMTRAEDVVAAARVPYRKVYVECGNDEDADHYQDWL